MICDHKDCSREAVCYINVSYDFLVCSCSIHSQGKEVISLNGKDRS